MMNKFFIIVSLLGFFGCSAFKKSSPKESNLARYRKSYKFVDKSGTFSMEKVSGLDSKSKRFFTKYTVRGSNGKELERSVVISRLGVFKKSVPVFQPFASQFQVWFDKERYQSETRFNPEDKSVRLFLKSPEEKWKGSKTVSLKDYQGLFCFLSQVIECAQFTGFLRKAISKKAGKMRLNLIWEGHPFISEQYLNLPKSLITDATLEYDGKNDDGEHRFTLSTIGNSIFYLLDKEMVINKVLWPGQGLSIIGN